MSLPRFYLAPADWASSALVLAGEEAHHGAEVLRLRAGDGVVVFDGQGRSAEARLVEVTKRRIALQIITCLPPLPPHPRITLAQAIPKGKTMEWIIEKATELGVAEIVPLLTDRTIVRLDAAEAARKQQKWQRIALEACKQCGQNWLPVVHEPLAISSWLAAAPTAELRLIAALTPAAQPLQTWLSTLPERPQSACVLVGPEGDFTPAEMELALTTGFLPLTMGTIILRAETAAIYALSILSHELNFTAQPGLSPPRAY